MFYGFIFIVLSMFLMAILGATILTTATSGQSFSSGFASKIGIILLSSCGGIILFVVSFILYLIGFVKLYTGRKEYTREHQKKVKYALYFFIIVILLAVSKQAFSFFPSMGVDGGSVRNFNKILSEMKPYIWASQILSVLQTFFTAMMSVYLVIELANEKIKKLLWTGAGVAIASSIIGFGISIYLLQGELTVDSLQAFSSLSSLILGLSSIGLIIFLVSYWKIYKRFKKGELPSPPPSHGGSPGFGTRKEGGPKKLGKKPRVSSRGKRTSTGERKGSSGHQLQERPDTRREKPSPPSESSRSEKEDENICPTCGSRMRYIEQHERWFCDNCRRYD